MDFIVDRHRTTCIRIDVWNNGIVSKNKTSLKIEAVDGYVYVFGVADEINFELVQFIAALKSCNWMNK